MRRAGLWSSAALLAVPGALLVFLSFNAGGFFPGAPAIVAAGLAVGLAGRLLLAERPLAGLSAGVGVAAGALALLAVWTFLSGSWGVPARALLEYDRTLLYGLALLVFGTLPFTPARLAWAVRGLALGILVVAVAGLLSWLLPEVWPAPPGSAEDRLSYPLTYWNALGLLSSIGALLWLHMACSSREPRAVRVLAAAAVPVLVTALFFTFSRGAIAAGLAGVPVLLLAARPRALLSGLLAVGPACAIALAAAYDADAITSAADRSAAATAQGEDVALALALACAVAALLRIAALPLDALVDRRLDARAPWPRPRLAAVSAVALVLVLVAALAAGAPSFAGRQYDRFVTAERMQEPDQRDRLRDPGNNGRLDMWRVAVEGWARAPVRGLGAGTYQTLWAQERPTLNSAVDGHSLYLEVLAELGVVGLALLVVALLAVLGGFAARARGPDRGPAGALLAAGVAWALHAGIDWDWEMPALTLWLFALGGLALAAPEGRPRLPAPGLIARIALALGCLVLAVTPVQVARSQGRLDTAVEVFRAGDCAETIDRALASLDAVGARPEPLELIGYCDVRLGEEELAVRSLERAIARDPRNWELHYGLALVRGAVGLDPRPAIRRARELNPLEPIVLQAAEAFDTSRERAWERRARRLPLPGALRE